jgi:type I restriction enzyme S subunit
MEEWKEYKLGEVLTIKYGKDHKQIADGHIPIYGSGGIMRYGEQSLYEGPSILIPRKGSLNNIMYSDKPFWTVDTMFWTIINSLYKWYHLMFVLLCVPQHNNLQVHPCPHKLHFCLFRG